MKVEQEHKIGLFDIDFQFRLRMQAAARLFQEVSSFHSTQVGAGPNVLFERGFTWFLNRFEIEFFRYPMMRDDVKLQTWSRGFKRFKGFREFVMTSDEGEIARGSTVFIFFDFKRNRISKIPQDILDCYESLPDTWFENEIDTWHPCGRIDADESLDITLRYSDYDINGHVNNTLYFGFVETLYHHSLRDPSPLVRNIKIRFNKEIDRSVKTVRAGWEKSGSLYRFNICDDTNLYADGEITPMERH